MSRIPVPATDRINAASLPLLDAVRKELGIVPNLMKVLANSPSALGGYLRLNAALAGGSLGVKTGERIALAVAEVNGCGYCLAAHTYLGKHVAGLDDDEMTSNRAGRSSDARAISPAPSWRIRRTASCAPIASCCRRECSGGSITPRASPGSRMSSGP